MKRPAQPGPDAASGLGARGLLRDMKYGYEEENAVQESREQPAPQLAGHVLANHLEAQSLQFEAGHRRALARQSAVEVRRTFDAMQAKRLAYEAVCHRLDPRHDRTVSFGVALPLQAAIFVVLAALDAVEFTGVLTGWTMVAVFAAAAAWSGVAWLAALAVREKSRGVLAAITGGAGVLGLLMTALRATAPSDHSAGLRYNLGVGLLAAVLIFILVAASAALIVRTEPASLMLARRRWHRARADFEAAVRTHHEDAEADAIAGQDWNGFLRTQARPAAGTRPRLGPSWPASSNHHPGPGV